jgi:uroporphyrin-III C-methyltransferase/precorrin-2 dehydrogenase/sirohydrochlorin ferrochelatase
MRYLPLFLDMRGKPVLVVGGGAVAERKVALLREAGAQVTVNSPTLTPQLQALVAAKAIVHVGGDFNDGLIGQHRLVVAATDRAEVNREAARCAEARGVWVNVVDDAATSSCIVPAIVDRSPLMIAISSGGAAPMLARLVREKLEIVLGESLGRIAAFCQRWRAVIVARIREPAARRRFYTEVLQGPIAGLINTRRDADADLALQQALAGISDTVSTGRVILVGAGPGDPGLLTVNALRALQEADVILYDRLVSVQVLNLARRDAEQICVGKEPGVHCVDQSHTHELMSLHALAGKVVVRLKGGDPFIFGRGGEEMEYLRDCGVRYEIVPGVTAAMACAAYAGIPLTHRGYADSVRFITAHCRESLDRTDWRALAQGRETLAIYMGVGQLNRVVEGLLSSGRAASTPMAIIEKGTSAAQRVLHGTLDSIEYLAAKHKITSPALIVVGEVTELGKHLHWFGAEGISEHATLETRAAQH